MKKAKSIVAIAMTVLCVGLFGGCGSEDTSNVNDDSNTNKTVQENTVYEQDFTLINQTGVEINNLYISPSEQDNWGSDVLTTDTLPSGSQVKIKFAPDQKAQYWDLKVSDKEGTEIKWQNIDLFTISEITLQFDGTTPTASFK